VAWRQNHRLNGVEIHFSRRPDDAALIPIRNARHNGDRWRYNGHDHCWWIKQCPEAIAFAAQFCEQFARGTVTCTATSGEHPLADPIVSPPVVSPLQMPPRKIIRFCQPVCQAEVRPAPSLLSSVASAEEEAAQRKDPKRELLAQQARAEFYEANPAPVDVVALMRPKGVLIN